MSASGSADRQTPDYIDQLLQRALGANASDIHLEPVAVGSATGQAGGMEVKFRIDGLLERADMLPIDVGRSAVLRLMVMAQLLTYRLDIPQEGRIHTTVPVGGAARNLDLRLAVMPVAHGLRAVVRLPAELTQPRTLRELGLGRPCVEALERFAAGDSGMMLVTGPAGSGKTTTIYALLEHIARSSPGAAIIALEDPIERLLAGVTQIEVTPHGQLTYERALKSILRQDPQVLMLGEIRDLPTATVAVQAALSGHRLIATLHAGDPATALARLLEMGIEPYQIASSVVGVLSQRLVRRLSPDGAGYKGRIAIAEYGQLDTEVRKAILDRSDAHALRISFQAQSGHVTLQQAAEALVRQGLTDANEVRRVLG